jgi:hypothetical protein
VRLFLRQDECPNCGDFFELCKCKCIKHDNGRAYVDYLVMPLWKILRHKFNILCWFFFSKEFFKFLSVGICYSLMAVGVYWYFSDTLGVKAWFVTVLWTPIGFLLRFVIEKLWVFKKDG